MAVRIVSAGTPPAENHGAAAMVDIIHENRIRSGQSGGIWVLAPGPSRLWIVAIDRFGQQRGRDS
jgi:hypothetical protein